MKKIITFLICIIWLTACNKEQVSFDEPDTITDQDCRDNLIGIWDICDPGSLDIAEYEFLEDNKMNLHATIDTIMTTVEGTYEATCEDLDIFLPGLTLNYNIIGISVYDINLSMSNGELQCLERK